MDKNFLDTLFTSPVGILGEGVSGKAVSGLLDRLGVDYVVYSEGKGGKLLSEESITNHRLIVYSPGFAQDHQWICLARQSGCKCLGELDFASIFWKGNIIAITGTNGKTTLTTFLTEALNANNVAAVSVGNVGIPFSSVCELSKYRDSIAVCEVSSFQLEDIYYFKPSVILWTNISEDHIARHGSMINYFKTKYKLIDNFDGDFLLIGESVKEFAHICGVRVPESAKILVSNEAFIPSKGVFSKYPHSENYQFALQYWRLKQFSEQILIDLAETFQLPRHRLQLVAKIDGVEYWNDSKGTNFASALAALKSFGKRVIWIGGGSFKGGDIEGFVNNIAPYVDYGVLIGETASALEKGLQKNKIRAVKMESMESAVSCARNLSFSGNIVLLSPGFSSFDMFNNYEHRGKCYENEVLGLKNRFKPSIS